MKSIEFSTPMMQALLNGRKTQTRRVVKKPRDMAGMDFDFSRALPVRGAEYLIVPYKHPDDEWGDGARWRVRCPYGELGDTLWVKEPLKRGLVAIGSNPVMSIACYAADKQTTSPWFPEPIIRWRWKNNTLPARFCPREASRLTLRLTDVRVERVQDITEEGARAEGVEVGDGNCCAVGAFEQLWESIHGEGAWERNDWVWVLGFEVVQ